MNLGKPEPHLWLKIEQFLATPLDDHSALLRVLGRLDAVASAVEAPALVVVRGQERAVYRGWSGSVTKRRWFVRRDDTWSSLLWRATFEVPLHVVECGGALFTLTGDDRLAIALPAPRRRERRVEMGAEATRFRPFGGQVRRHAVALGAGFAAAVAVSAGGIASATTTAAPVGPASSAMITAPATTPDTTSTGTDASMSGDTASTSTSTSTSTDTTTTAPPPTTSTSTQTTTTDAPPATSTTPPTTTNPSPATTVTAPPVTVTSPVDITSSSGATSATPSVTNAPTPSSPTKGHQPTTASGPPSSSATPAPEASIHSHSTTSRHSRPAHSDAPKPWRPAGTAETGPTPPSLLSFGAQVGLDPFTAAQIAHFETIGASLDQPPAFLIPIYKAAGRRYHVPWQILAAINAIETDYGRDLSVSVAGAVGWMQFEPGTWLHYGVRVDGSGAPNPYDPKDAIFSAARYLAANGAPDHLRQALFAYNHALWYVYAVLWRAQVITDRSVAHADGALAGTGNTGLAGAETMLVAALSAVGGPYSQANHDSFGQTAADLRRAGTDCSGFVSWVLDQVDPSFGNQTTVTLPDQPGVQPGVGRYVTMWDRPLPGDQGHVIIDILGTWFESGGNSSYNPAGGISPLTGAQAVGELTGGGFLPYHLKRL